MTSRDNVAQDCNHLPRLDREDARIAKGNGDDLEEARKGEGRMIRASTSDEIER